MSAFPSSAAPTLPLAVDAGWRLSLYPDAGEGGGCFVSSQRPDRSYVAPGSAVDPERAAQEAARRARAKLRRYCAANRLHRLGTLTYGEPRCTDPRLVRAHTGLFFRQLRDSLGGDPLPYAWVPELHKDGVHFHVHFAVGRYISRHLISEAWGREFLHIKLLGDLPVVPARSVRRVWRRGTCPSTSPRPSPTRAPGRWVCTATISAKAFSRR
ncbi:rolling circle replication-associated protein [Kocuria rosea]|uniref:rolling circle replication-associated protein n=1 Tax=Kocuria rosea TaxID=1275 RepID=UPI003D15F950